MLTRSHARALVRKEAAARAATIRLVALSATGKGTHVRWTYPEDENDRRSKHPIAHMRTRSHSPTSYETDHTATCLMGSCSSISSSEESSSEASPVVTPTNSFDAHVSFPITPQRTNKPLTTPPRLSPKKLQRSPPGRWITANGATRIVFMEDSQEQAEFREMQDETKYQRIEERELETLLRKRDIADGEEDGDFVMDVETQTSGTWRNHSEVDTGVGRGDTELLETRGIEGPPGPIELVGSNTFMPDSSQESRVETWRQGVL